MSPNWCNHLSSAMTEPSHITFLHLSPQQKLPHTFYESIHLLSYLIPAPPHPSQHSHSLFNLRGSYNLMLHLYSIKISRINGQYFVRVISFRAHVTNRLLFVLVFSRFDVSTTKLKLISWIHTLAYIYTYICMHAPMC